MPASLPILSIGKHTPRFPLIQGGMGVRISGPGLAAAVAKAGGIGTIASVGLAVASESFDGRNYFEVNQVVLREEIQKARAASDGGIIAVNAMVALTDYDLHIKAACEGGVDMIISGAGLPLRLPELTKDFPDVALVPIVSSTKAANLIVRRWDKLYGRLPDAFVVETPLYAGGHLGVTKMEQVMDEALSLESVVPELVSYIRDEVKADIPVIGAGGVWNREDMNKVFALGAKGVQMGTRFATTLEGDADIRFKQALIDASEEDVVIIKSPVGIPGRALRSPFIEKYLEGTVESKPCFANCLSHCSYRTDKQAFCIAQALVDAYRGNWEEGLFFCGSNVGKIEKMENVEEIFRDLFGD
ncbi:MAG TPA: nitronate monooxygenase family protein [Thermovirgaceae bacterium]|nr:nitronate monooxygenase family protein [Thermovirgaceae bacterium]